jgi:hypothetical protein
MCEKCSPNTQKRVKISNITKTVPYIGKQEPMRWKIKDEKLQAVKVKFTLDKRYYMAICQLK